MFKKKGKEYKNLKKETRAEKLRRRELKILKETI